MVRGLTSSLGRSVLSSYVNGCNWMFPVFSGVWLFLDGFAFLPSHGPPQLYLLYWSVRRLKASPTPPCGIFNIIISGMRGLGIQIVLSCLVVLLSCLVVLSEYQKVNKDDWLTVSVIYFRNLLSNWDSGEKVLKSFKEVGLAKSEKKLHPYFSEGPKCYIFLKSS